MARKHQIVVQGLYISDPPGGLRGCRAQGPPWTEKLLPTFTELEIQTPQTGLGFRVGFRV